MATLLLPGSATALADVLSITKTGPGGVKPGDDVVYTIVVSNTGPGDLAGVALDDPAPSGLMLVTVSGDCTAFPCAFATIPSAGTRTVLATFRVPPAYNGPDPIVNVAVAHTSATDGVTATASTAVTRIAGFHTLPPCRIVDTRLTTGVPIGGPALAAGGVRTLNVREACGLPGNATAISFNLTVTDPTAAGNLRIAPGGSIVPSSAINYLTGQTRANNGIVPLSGAGTLSVQCDQSEGTTHLILDVNGYFAATDVVATPAGQNVHIRPAPEVALTFDSVTTAGMTGTRVLEFVDNRTSAVDQDLRDFFPAGSPERALLPSVVVPGFIKPLGKGGPGGPPTFVLTLIDTTATFNRTVEFHGFEDFRLGWDPPCVNASDPTQEPRTFYARDSTKNEPALVEETGYQGQPVFVDISSGCGSNKGSGWNFSFYLTAKDTRSPHDIALYMLNQMQAALSAFATSITDAGVASTLSNYVSEALANLLASPALSRARMPDIIALVDANPTAFDNTARNVAGELAGRALSAMYMLDKVAPRLTEFTLPLATSLPLGIAAGPDGNLWFALEGVNQIGRITPSGVITSFTIPTPGSRPNGIAAGPDGNLWFTEYGANQIGRITTSGAIIEFPLPTQDLPLEITAGPDGNLWFTKQNGSTVWRITPTGVLTEFPLPTAGCPCFGIAAGPDGNLWFTEYGANQIGRITPAGLITEFTVPTTGSGVRAIAAGPDGNLWFTEASGNRIGRITPTGVITEFPLPVSSNLERSAGIAAGADGNLWFTGGGGVGEAIGRITPTGVVTSFPLPYYPSSPIAIVAGPDGNLWFTEQTTNKIGRFSP